MTESAVPILPSRDLGETFAFLERLGFENAAAHWSEWNYLIVRRGGIELHYFAHPEIDPFTTDAMCYLRVPDADALYDEWSEIGVESDPSTGSRLMPPETTEYRMREFALVDKSGNLYRIGSPAA